MNEMLDEAEREEDDEGRVIAETPAKRQKSIIISKDNNIRDPSIAIGMRVRCQKGMVPMEVAFPSGNGHVRCE